MVMDKIEDLVKNEVKRTFNPEFLNRIDEIILFQSLTDADLIQIVELLLGQLNNNLAQKAITISVTDDAKKWILEKTLVDRSYGARPLRRALQRYVEDPLSEALIAGGILARRFPGVIPVSDFVAVAFVLALPLAVWFRLDRLQEEQEDAELESESYISDRRGFLGLSNDITDARLVESLSKLEVKPVDLLPAAQAFHPEVPSEEAKAAASHLIRSAQAPASQALVPAAPPAEIGPPQVSALAPVSDLTVGPALTGVEGFRKHLALMTGSWQRIETVRGEIDDWFERRRQEAIAHLDMHPGIRPTVLEQGLFENFPGEKLAAVDAEWAEIRKAVFEINRWFEQIPVPDKSK